MLRGIAAAAAAAVDGGLAQMPAAHLLHQSAAADSTTRPVGRYEAGFADCLAEVEQFMTSSSSDRQPATAAAAVAAVGRGVRRCPDVVRHLSARLRRRSAAAVAEPAGTGERRPADEEEVCGDWDDPTACGLNAGGRRTTKSDELGANTVPVNSVQFTSRTLAYRLR